MRSAALAVAAFFAACQQTPGVDDERRRLEALLDANRQGHLRTDAELLAAEGCPGT